MTETAESDRTNVIQLNLTRAARTAKKRHPFGDAIMTLQQLLADLRVQRCDFEDTLAWIAEHYDYQPAAFDNGLDADTVHNAAGQNEGACRVFALGLAANLGPEDTLLCFGRHLRDVLADPAGSSHANIRQFQRHGWAGIRFHTKALHAKT